MTKRRTWLPVIVGLLTGWTAACATPAAARAGEKPPADTSPLIAWFTIGWSAQDPASRNIGWGLCQTGWEKFVEVRVRPQLDWGIRRILLHNPFGALADEDMQFSQFVQAKKQSLPLLTDREAFLRAWKPVTAQGVEVIAYVGSPTASDREYGPLLKTGDEAGRRTLETACLEPLLAAGMSIAFDAASGQDADSATFALARRLRAAGTRVYIEALPPVTAKHWLDFPAMCTTAFWNNPERPAWNLTETNAGTVILAMDEARNWVEWETVLNRYRRHVGEGRSVAIGSLELEKLRRSRMPAERLLKAEKAVK